MRIRSRKESIFLLLAHNYLKNADRLHKRILSLHQVKLKKEELWDY